MVTETVSLETFMKVQVVTLDKRIAKQIQFHHFPSRKEMDTMKIVGYITRDALESGSREAYLVEYDGGLRFVPAEHLRLYQPDIKVPQIFVK